MAAETQYTANTGTASISTANTNRDGTGTLGTVLTAAANGTLIKTVTIKATGNTTQGMIRLYVGISTNYRLIDEIEVPAVTKSANDPAFEVTIPLNLKLASGATLRASTQNAETFMVTAEGLDWAYYASSVRPESTNYTANTSSVVISTANTNLDGTGTLGTVITAGVAASGWKGCKIQSLTIKALVSTTDGMVRIFTQDLSSNKKLLTEIPVPAITKSATVHSFEQTIFLSNYEIQAGWAILASTEKAESFALTAQGMDWKYPA